MKLMKTKYLLFVYDKYYPSGGFHDLKGAYLTIEESLKFVRDGYYYHIVDIETLEIVSTNHKDDIFWGC